MKLRKCSSYSISDSRLRRKVSLDQNPRIIMLDQEQLAQAIKNSINPDEETRKNATNILLEFVKNPPAADVSLNLLYTSQEDTVQSGAAIYARKAIKSFWEVEDFSRRAAIQNMLMQIISTKTYSENVTNQILDIIKYIYGKDETNWPDLMSYIQSIAGSKLSLLLLTKILPKMNQELVENIKEFLLALSLNSITSEDVSLKVLGILLFNQYIIIIKDNPNSPQHLEAIIPLLTLSAGFDKLKDLETVWSCVNDLLIFEAIPEEMLMGVVTLALQMAQNKEQDPHLRHVPLEALVPALSYFDFDLVSQILSLSLDITARIIEQDGVLCEDSLSEFDVATQSFDHSIMYPLIRNQIQQAFSSGSCSHQIVGLLLFALLLNSYSDLIYNDMEEVLAFLHQAIQSEEDLLKEAALKVIQQFPQSFKSSNQYSPTFIPLIIPLITSPNSSLSHHAIVTLYNIFSHIDTEIPNQIDDFIKVFDQISPDSMIEYLSIFPYLVLLSEDFSDENCDQILQIISTIIQSNSPEDVAVCFEIGHALLQIDESQLPFVTEKLFPFILPFLQLDHTTNCHDSIINEVYDFIGNLSIRILRDSSYEAFQQIIPIIIEAIKDKTYSNELKSCMVINIAKLAKFGGPAQKDLIDVLVPEIIELIATSGEEAIQNASDAAMKLKKLLSPAQAKIIFDSLMKCLNQENKFFDYITSVFKAISKLLLVADQSNLQDFLGQIVEFINSVFSNKWPLLQEKTVLESPYSNDILSPLCYLFSAVVHFQTPINDVICQYLMQWMEKNNQLDLFEITGPLTDCIQFGFVSEETKQLIFTAIGAIMPNATEPSLVQNIVFLMNLLIQNSTQLLQTVVDSLPTFENYRQLALSKQFGYQEVLANIASLYLQIAIRKEMPVELVVFAVQQFPPHDVEETSSMVKAMIELVKNSQNPDLLIQVCLAFTRFFVQETAKIEQAKVSDELKNIMVQFLKAICSKDQQILMNIRGTYGKQKSKLRKIETILNS